MKSRPVWIMPAVALLLVASGGGVWADTSDVKGPAPVIVGKSGKHCKDDPHCFNRYHFDSTAQDVATANLNLVHPLTGPVGAERGDALANPPNPLRAWRDVGVVFLTHARHRLFSSALSLTGRKSHELSREADIRLDDSR